MTLKSRKVFSALHMSIIVLSLVSSPLAQAPRARLGIQQVAAQEPRRTEEERKGAKELEKKALALIDEVVAEAMSLRRVENRIFTLASASDFLWERDEERARALVCEAMDQVVAHMREVKEKAAQESGSRSDPRNYLRDSVLYPLYRLLNLLAKRDAKLALEFLQLARPLWLDERLEKKLELDVASQVAESDPQTALRIAERHLESKLDYQVVNFWGDLLGKDPKAASTLTEKIIGEVKSQDLLLADRDAFWVVFRVLDILKSLVTDIAITRNSPDAAKTVQTDSAGIQQVYRDALEIIAAVALKVTAAQLEEFREGGWAQDLLKQIQSFSPEIEKHLPSRAQAVRDKLAQLGKAFYLPPAPQQPSWEEIENIVENKSPDELIAMADRLQSEPFKYWLHQQAAAKLAEKGDPARARRIVKEILLPGGEMDVEFSKQFLAWIDGKEREQAIKEGKIEDVRNSVSRLRWVEERASAWIELAVKAGDDKDQKSRRESLKEASELLGDQMETQSQVEAQLNLAAASLDLDPDRGFEILEAAIDRLNMVLNAKATLAKFSQRMKTPDGVVLRGGNMDDEWSIGIIDHPASILHRHLLAFARKDFDRAVASLKHLQVNEFRLAICLSLLSGITGVERDDGR